MFMHKISVIIPVYNVEKYLSACMESIIHQTYKNLEIILVNDGSTDSCPQICEEYAAKDNRIKVIHKKNGGLSDARNSGLEIATGEFISFVDSDDLLSLDFCQRLLDALIESDADIVECDFVKFEEETEEINEVEETDFELFNTLTALELLIKDYIQPMVWNKLYRRQVLENIKFPIGKIHEDVFWTYRVLGNAKRIVKIKKKMYWYRQQAKSIMGMKYSLQRLDAVEALEERIEYMKEFFPSLENLAIKVFCFNCTYHYQQIYINPNIDPNKVLRKTIFSKVSKYNKFSIFKDWHWKEVVWYQLFIYVPKIYMKLRDYMELKAQKIISK